MLPHPAPWGVGLIPPCPGCLPLEQLPSQWVQAALPYRQESAPSCASLSWPVVQGEEQWRGGGAEHSRTPHLHPQGERLLPLQLHRVEHQLTGLLQLLHTKWSHACHETGTAAPHTPITNLHDVPLALDSAQVLDVVLHLRDGLCGEQVQASLLPRSLAEPLHAQHQEAAVEEATVEGTRQVRGQRGLTCPLPG